MISHDQRLIRIKEILSRNFSPSFLEVNNFSSLHASHNHQAESMGDTHYSIVIGSDLFVGKSNVQSHRMVMDSLRDEFSSGLHALQIKILSNSDQG